MHGLEGFPADRAERIVKRVKRQICGKDGCLAREGDRPFEEERFVKAAELLEHAVGDEGYAYATVQRAADVDLPKNRVAVGYFVKLGPKARYGKVTIVGLGKVPEEPVRRALDLTEGKPYSRTELDLAERALLDLNVFSSVVITPGLDQKGATEDNPTIPIKVTVETAKLKAIHVGGGALIDSLQTDLHLVGGWNIAISSAAAQHQLRGHARRWCSTRRAFRRSKRRASYCRSSSSTPNSDSRASSRLAPVVRSTRGQSSARHLSVERSE